MGPTAQEEIEEDRVCADAEPKTVQSTGKLMLLHRGRDTWAQFSRMNRRWPSKQKEARIFQQRKWQE